MQNNRNRVARGFSSYHPNEKTKERSKSSLLFFGWGTGIRTPVMTESESVALPLGDAPIFSTLHIIAEFFSVVNTYFQLF